MSEELSQSDIFVLLSERRRRLSLRVIRESPTPITIEALTEQVGEREYRNPSAEVLSSVRLSLYHNHLPRLEEAVVVVYDRDQGTVRPGLNFDDVVRALERVTDRDLPWSDE